MIGNLPECCACFCGIGDITLIQFIGLFSNFAQCFVELELVDGPGEVPKEKSGWSFT